jgi:hypothetical protein
MVTVGVLVFGSKLAPYSTFATAVVSAPLSPMGEELRGEGFVTIFSNHR